MINQELWRWRLATIGLVVASMIAVALDATGLAIGILLLACVVLIFFGRVATGGYANFACIFLFFFLLYGLSGPIAAHFGEGLHAVFPRPYRTNDILLLTGLSVIGLAIGMWSAKLKPAAAKGISRPRLVAQDLYVLGFFFAAVASAMEITNTFRAGGIAALVLGKAIVQSTVADMAWTLPAEPVLVLAASFHGLAIAEQRVSESARQLNIPARIGFWIVLAGPSLLIYLVLGRRSVLLSVALALLVGASWKFAISRLRWIVILAAVVCYVFMGVLFAARTQIGIALATGDWNELRRRATTTEFWARSLNPAAIEFGGTFGNINTYLLAGERPLLLGQSYLEGLAAEIPRSVWPDKPQTATYVFRDTHYPELAKRGSIAGTAFSSLLEALMNFGVAGVLLVYIAIGAGISWLERVRMRGRSALLFPLFYLLVLPEAMRFHRSALDNPIAWPLLLAVAGTISYLVLRGIKPHARQPALA